MPLIHMLRLLPGAEKLMQCVANYEIRSECCVLEDGHVLEMRHPNGTYRGRIRNIPRSTFATPFLLALDLYFEAPSLDQAQDVADSHLVEVMNMLAFVTGCSLTRQRIRLIFDATPEKAMRDVRMWSDILQFEDPKPLLSRNIAQAVELLSQFDLPPALRKAMRWYRLGVNASAQDDQFMNFWFALEILAEYQKPTERVPDVCQVCKSPLFCETCRAHSMHRPFATQAIEMLMRRVDKTCDDAVVRRLFRSRNRLMHGDTLEEIDEQGKASDAPEEHVVNILGRLVWRAVIFQFPHEIINGQLGFFYPSTYLNYTMNAVMHISTVMQADSNANFDVDAVLKGMKAEMVPLAPPQSGRPARVRFTAVQFERLSRLAHEKPSDSQSICSRIWNTAKRMQEDNVYAIIFSTDLPAVRAAMANGNNQEEWVNLLREVVWQKGE